MIAIVSHAQDDHALAVTQALVAAGRAPVLIDTAGFPTKISLSLSLSNRRRALAATFGSRSIDFDSLRSVWWRRPQPYELDPNLDRSAASFAYSECHEAMAGLWHSLDAAWVNPPEADEVAHHKPLQLALAVELGLTIPDTLITNDPANARAFAERYGPHNTIYKTFIAQESHWRETRVLADDEIPMLDQVTLAPVIFQEFVRAECDLRVTVFGDEIHATEIVSSEGAYPYDYRVDLGAVTMTDTTLPAELETGLLQLLRRLGLQYGAIDLRRTHRGEYVFLEVNPAGEFLFVQERSGQDLSGAMARLLVRLAEQPVDTKVKRDKVGQ